MKKELDALTRGEHYNPHQILGGHFYLQGGNNGVMVRAFHPDAVKVTFFTLLPNP